jgi:hypothetical protein
MARRNNNKMTRSAKVEPAITELRFGLAAAGVPTYLDLNQINSLVNRRFYRQGLMNAVQSIEVQFTPNVPGTPATGTVTISKLPSTWIFANAWMKSMSVWQRMNNEALEETETLRPRFLDFKIYADAEHHAQGFGQNMKPFSTATGIGVPFTGEWESSKIFIPNATNAAPATTQDFEIIGVGDSFPGVAASGYDALSAIEGYAASRLLPNVVDPNTPGDADDTGGATPENWMSAIFNDGLVQMSEVIEELTSENNVAPYPFENGPIQGFPGTTFTDTMYPGGGNQFPGLQFHDKLLITTSTIGGSDTAIGGLFPCGLIRFDTSITAGTAEVIIRLVPGTHRGLMAFPMQEM